MSAAAGPVAAARQLEHFGPDHLAAIIGTVLLAVGACAVLRLSAGGRGHEAVRVVVCYGLAAILGISMAAMQLDDIFGGRWAVDRSLPLHLCHIVTLLAIPTLIVAGSTRNEGPEAGPATRLQRATELVYYWSMGGTTQGLLTPEIHEPFPTIAYLRFFSMHGGVIVAAFVLTVGLRRRPRSDSVLFACLVTIGLASVVFVVNQLLGVNYMYLAGPPARPSLYDLLGPWPWSLASMVAVGTVAYALLYSPWWVADRLRVRKSGGAKRAVPAARR